MTTWTKDELDRIEHADELAIAPRQDPGTLDPPTTIRVVRDGADLYVRAYRERGGAWFRAAQARHEGRISAGGVERDVTFLEVDDPDVNERLDVVHRGKHGRRSAEYVESLVAGTARAATLKLVPR
ncbi:DUF2255 family protein [Actinacidiphila sp. bgisy160]|uniref:DUF2255 family protein n=1 Tax=Actinacidiphila sp. bgisy160 TaxID=3413796 RepID=UPI003D741535